MNRQSVKPHPSSKPASKVARVTLVQMTLADLKDHPRNPRKHPDPGTPEWNALKASLANAYFDPIVVNVRKGANYMTLVSGHLRRKVLMELGYTGADASTVDVSDDVHLAMMLAANKAQGENDDVKLAPILFELQAVEGFNVEMTGFTMPEVTGLCVDTGLMEAPTVTEDEAPIDRAKELQKKWGTRRAQVWECGRHRVMCGDSTNAKDVKRLLDVPPQIVVTSPPYPGADMWNDVDEKTEDRIARLDELNARLLQTAFDSLEPNGVALWNIADVPWGNHGVTTTTTTTTTTMACKCIGFTPRGAIIWDKGCPNLPPPAFMRRPVIPAMAHETILLLYKGDWKPREKATGVPDDDKQWILKSVWPITTEKASLVGHKAPFPVELARRCIVLWSIEGDVVFDLCLGSGTTLIAAEQAGRIARGMEIDPGYTAVVLERFATLTGQTPKRISP